MADFININSNTNITYMHTRSDIIPINFHLHDGFEIYILISGDVNYFIEKKVYPLKYGDIIITNNYEVHTPSFQSGKTYERIIVQFTPDIPERFSTPDFNLLDCFVNRPLGVNNKVTLGKNQLNEFTSLLSRIEAASVSDVPGSDIVKTTAFIDLLVFINRAYSNTSRPEDHPNVPDKLLPILDYIDENLDDELSLVTLENRFYLNRFYLSRLFKECTGINIHEYITFKRISKAKMLLSSGSSVTDACGMSGFSDYSNFIRVFKKIVGVPPGQYKKQAK